MFFHFHTPNTYLSWFTLVMVIDSLELCENLHEAIMIHLIMIMEILWQGTINVAFAHYIKSVVAR